MNESYQVAKVNNGFIVKPVTFEERGFMQVVDYHVFYTLEEVSEFLGVKLGIQRTERPKEKTE